VPAPSPSPLHNSRPHYGAAVFCPTASPHPLAAATPRRNGVTGYAPRHDILEARPTPTDLCNLPNTETAAPGGSRALFRYRTFSAARWLLARMATLLPRIFSARDFLSTKRHCIFRRRRKRKRVLGMRLWAGDRSPSSLRAAARARQARLQWTRQLASALTGSADSARRPRHTHAPPPDRGFLGNQ